MNTSSEYLEADVEKQTLETLREDARGTEDVRGNAFERLNMAPLGVDIASILSQLTKLYHELLKLLLVVAYCLGLSLCTFRFSLSSNLPSQIIQGSSVGVGFSSLDMYGPA